MNSSVRPASAAADANMRVVMLDGNAPALREVADRVCVDR